MKAIYKKELKLLSCSFTGYIFSAVFLLSFGGFSVIYNLINGQSSFSSVISLATLPMIILIPILTMRTFAEERHQKSDKLIYSLPIDIWQVVLGKYLSLLTWILIPFLVICTYPLGLSSLGEINLISCYGALFAFFILTSTLISIGMFISSLTENQMVAAALSFLVFLALFLLPVLSTGISTAGSASVLLFSMVFLALAFAAWAISRNIIVAAVVFILPEIPIIALYLKDIRLMSGKFAQVLDAVSLFNYFGLFTGGIFDIAAIVLFVSIAVLFLFLTVQVLEKRRWS